MKNKILYFLIFFSIIGCTTRNIDDWSESDKLLQLRPIEENTIKTEVKKELDVDRDKIELILAPDLKGKPQKQDWAYGVPIKNVSMEIVSMWDDGSNYRVTIQFDNSEGPSITASVTLFAYDRMGRLLRTDNFEKYFREGTISTTLYTFAKTGKEVRWVLTLTGKK